MTIEEYSASAPIEHSPLPWKVEHEFTILSKDGRRSIATTGGYSSNDNPEQVHVENIANAQFVVRACNSFEVLRNACLDVRLSLQLLSNSPDIIDTLLHEVLKINISKLDVAIDKADKKV